MSTSDPWRFDRPQQGGQGTGLLVEDLYPSEVQDRELAAELAAELAGDFEGPLPGFEATTWADLADARAFGEQLESGLDADCPAWCVGTDDDTHLGVEHLVRPANGGGSFGYEGSDIAVSLQLEQGAQRELEQDAQRDPGQGNAPVIVLQLQVNGQDQRAYLTSTEAFELRAILGGLLTDISAGC